MSAGEDLKNSWLIAKHALHEAELVVDLRKKDAEKAFAAYRETLDVVYVCATALLATGEKLSFTMHTLYESPRTLENLRSLTVSAVRAKGVCLWIQVEHSIAATEWDAVRKLGVGE